MVKTLVMNLNEPALQRFEQAAMSAGMAISDHERELLCHAADWLASLSRASGISGYETASLVLLRSMAPALAYFGADEAPRSGRIADIGAGNGAIGATIAILEQNLLVDLVDRAQRAYTACEILAARLGLPNLRAVRADVRGLAAAEYDAAVFRALATGERALPLVRRIVRPGGFIGAFHRAEDSAFQPDGGSGVATAGSWTTLVEELVLTGYRV